MPQHTLWRKDDERLTPNTQRLPAQHMKILCSRRRLANLHIVLSGELHITLDACTGMLGALALVAMGKQKNQPGGKIPLVFAGAQELIDDHLCAIGKISALRFPKNQRLRIVAAEAVFEPDASRFGKRRVVNLAKRLLPRKMRESEVVVLGFRVD